MNQVNEMIFKALGNRQRIRTQLDLTQMYRMMKRELGVGDQEFLAAFRLLEVQGAGSLIIGRRGNPNRFVWKYNLKQVAQAALKGENLKGLEPLDKKSRLIQFAKGKPGPKPRTKKEFRIVTPKQLKTVPTLQIVINIPENTRPQDVQAYIDLAKDINIKK
jgi:hypothetical protein